MEYFKGKGITIFFLILYIAVGFLPSFGAIDKVAPQFLYLSIINLISVVFLLGKGCIKSFFNQKEPLIKIILILLTLYGIWGMTSSLYAVNVSEVLIESSRVFIYVISLLNIYLLIVNSEIQFISIALIISTVLIVESLWVLNTFFDLNSQNRLIERNLELRSFTGNINLTAFTMVLKTPFLIYCLFNFKRFRLIPRLLILLLVLSTIYLMGSRGANLTLFIIIITLISLSLFKNSFFDKKFALGVFITFLLSIGLNTIQFRDSKGLNFLQRTTTLNDQSSNERLQFYKNALGTIKENPIQGIGIGNWKMASIKFEGPDMDTYRVPYHVHNDFLEVTAELGLVGFILFYGIYIFLIIGYFKFFRSKVFIEKKLIGLTLALGHIVYLADSFLNFPFTRPVMQIPHLLLIALSVLLFSKEKIKVTSVNFSQLKKVKFPIYLFIFLGILFSSWISLKVYKSYVEQRFLILTVSGEYTDYSLKKVSSISSDIPNITAQTTPIDAIKAALFLRKDSLNVLPMIENGIKANPFMGYGELLKSGYFIQKDLIDSAFYYAKKSYEKLPKHINHFNHYLNLIQYTGDTLALDEISKELKESNSKRKLEKYLQVAVKVKNNVGLSESQILQKLSEVNPNNSFNNVFNILGQIGKDNIQYGVYFASLAEKEFNLKNFEKAADLFVRAATYNPLEKAYHENAANAFMKIEENKRAIEILESMIEDLDPQNGKAEYLLGIIYLDEKEKEKGCLNLNIAKRKGFKFPDQILKRFCN